MQVFRHRLPLLLQAMLAGQTCGLAVGSSRSIAPATAATGYVRVISALTKVVCRCLAGCSGLKLLEYAVCLRVC